MEAGRELDAIIATKVMGWEIGDGDTWQLISPECSVVMRGVNWWRPSTDIRDAWDVVEKLHKKNAEFVLRIYNQGQWCCDHNIFKFSEAYADTAPLAICLSALEAYEISDEG